MLPLAEDALWVAGFLMLLVAFYNAFRVVNYCSGISESGRIMLKLGYLPFLVFNIVVMGIELYGIAQVFGTLRNQTHRCTLFDLRTYRINWSYPCVSMARPLF